MSAGHRFLKFARQLHLYLGVFTAPMLLFFAVTGGLQTFSLHETTRGSSYAPPAWLASMAQLHKKQTTVVPARKLRPPERAAGTEPRVARSASVAPPPGDIAPAARAATDRGDTARPRKNLWPMKVFFGLVALGLLLSVLTGLYMAYRYSRKPVLVSAVLLAGILVPLLLLLF
ncbi:hypothetical protein ASG87_03490 [Frateuria sp. Soil773]|uniref:PepSY domain-containing protein n=1 Tax=Frateuria sp. Soil773 TaxID=1736407 RepID=UPI0006FB0A1E|nr:PepSY domain-containing protein [Frateuria sp. Soil773]KRE89416.1 hypothetical protein ASG87_03490 [Frateuria sp. Soil773]